MTENALFIQLPRSSVTAPQLVKYSGPEKRARLISVSFLYFLLVSLVSTSSRGGVTFPCFVFSRFLSHSK